MKIVNLKSGIIMLFLCFFSLFSYADGIVVSFNDEDGVYKSGDKVVAYVTSDQDMDLTCEILEYGTVLVKKSNLSLKKGRKTLLYSAKHKSPSHYMFKLSYEGQEKPELSGFIISPESYRAGYDCPVNIREFWDDQIARMRLTDMESSLSEINDFHSETLVCQDLTVNMHEGRPVRGYLCMPKDAQPKSLPIVIYAHSAGVNKVFNFCTTQRAVGLAEYGSGCIALDINAHGMENGQPQEYYDKLDKTTLKDYKDRPLENREDYYFRGMYLRVQRALDWLCTLPQWDGERVLVIGHSQGGAQTAAICGLDNRVTHAVIREPGMMDLGGFLAGRKSGPPHLVELYGQTEEFMKWAPYFDVAFFLEHSKAKLIYECGWVDMSCTPSSMMVGYNLAGGDKKICTSPYRRHQTPKGKYKDAWQETSGKWFSKFIKDALK